jgi:signal transduction histidine kinase
MTLIGPRTIRTKLTLITMLVMGAVLALLCVGVDQGVRLTLMKGIDDELRDRAIHSPLAHMLDGPFGRPPGPGMEGPHRHDHDGDHGRDGFHPGFGIPPGIGVLKRDDLGKPPNDPPTKQALTSQLGEETQPSLRPLVWRVGPSDPDEWPSPDQHEQPYDKEEFALARIGRPMGSKTIEVNGQPYRLLTTSVKRDGKVIGVAQITSPMGDTIRNLASMRRALITLVIPAGVVLSGLASLYLVGRFMGPLRMITHNAESIGASNAAERLPVVGQDEFASLAQTLNGMLSRLEEGLLLEQETNRRLEVTVKQQRRFTEDASHELKTPLAVIKANTGLMLHYGGSAEENLESVKTIDTAADRMTRMVQDLLVLARAEAGQLKPSFEIADIAAIVKESIGHVVGADGRVNVDSGTSPIAVKASKDELSRVFINLIDNALRHSGSECPVEVRVGKSGGMVTVAVRDYGDGIAPEHLPRLFDRFYRTDRSRSSDTGGTGLGLAICKGIVEAHGGQIAVASAVGEGSTFTVSLPLEQPSQS